VSHNSNLGLVGLYQNNLYNVDKQKHLYYNRDIEKLGVNKNGGEDLDVSIVTMR